MIVVVLVVDVVVVIVLRCRLSRFKSAYILYFRSFFGNNIVNYRVDCCVENFKFLREIKKLKIETI